MILAVVGSHILTPAQGRLVWPLISGLILYHAPAEVVSGGATGVDSVAEAAARQLGYDEGQEDRRLTIIRPEVPEWDPPGRNGYKARNDAIVARLQRGRDRLVRVAKLVNQTTYGSGYTADRAGEVLGADGVLSYYV